MSTYTEVKAQRIQAMKDKDELKKNILSTLIARFDYANISKLEGQEQEDAAQQVLLTLRTDLRKFLKDIQEKKITIDEKVQKELDKNMLEQNIIATFMPKVLDNKELEAIIDGLFAELNDFGTVMKALKKGYEGAYDGKHAATYAKSKA